MDAHARRASMAAKHQRLPMHVRNINPKIFMNYELFEAEHESGLPIFKTLVGLWCHADRAGRFGWKLKKLNAHIHPYDSQLDLEQVLGALVELDIVRKYEIDGETYGWLVKFTEYQYISDKEPPSLIPPHPDDVDDALGHPEGTLRASTGHLEGAPVLKDVTELKLKYEVRSTSLKSEDDGTSEKTVSKNIQLEPATKPVASLSQSQSSVQLSSDDPAS